MRRRPGFGPLRLLMMPPAMAVAVLAWVTRWPLGVVFAAGLAIGLLIDGVVLAMLRLLIGSGAGPLSTNRRSGDDRT
ncbi:MAG: hypothetical protein R3236_06460 [Phycisphaeraceae bacterium]|nr:hypothetical protein [Phycisphaeraceae bacterium]